MDILKNKTVLSALLLFVLVIAGYNFFLKEDPAVPTSGQASKVIGEDLLQISDEISKVTLKQELFSSPNYLKLTDFSLPLPQESLGRKNPFDALGRD